MCGYSSYIKIILLSDLAILNELNVISTDNSCICEGNLSLKRDMREITGVCDIEKKCLLWSHELHFYTAIITFSAE